MSLRRSAIAGVLIGAAAAATLALPATAAQAADARCAEGQVYSLRFGCVTVRNAAITVPSTMVPSTAVPSTAVPSTAVQHPAGYPCLFTDPFDFPAGYTPIL
jgi:hypothetical protein